MAKKMGIVRVTDAQTGKLKRFEDEHGRALAVSVGGKLKVTVVGAERGLVISKGKLHEVGSEFPAY